MSKLTGSELRTKLVEKIRNYDQLISGYLEDDTPKSEAELENMTVGKLQNWLNCHQRLRMEPFPAI